MNVIFSAQGRILKVFHALDQSLRARGIVEKSAYWIADSEYHYRQLSNLPLLSQLEVRVLEERSYTDCRSLALPEHWQALEVKYELKATVWDAIVADRRLMFGPLCKVKQQYNNRFSHDQLKRIIYSALSDIDKLIEDVKPHRIITFVPATFGDILLYQAALVHGIQYRVLRSTKIRNFVAFSDQLGASSSWLENAYQENLKTLEKAPHFSSAEDFLKSGSSAPVSYEGSIAHAKQSFFSSVKKKVRGAASATVQLARRYRQSVVGDNHLPPVWGTYIYGNLLRAKRERAARRLMRLRQVSLDNLNSEPYVFYPLHSEPEVALSVYGREHQNQIETMRRIAQSIPLSWRLVVKEHPRSLGYRNDGYYKKLLEIPNLYFADPDIRPFYWNAKSQAVVTVSGFAGFEAAMVGIPVLVLGDASFSLLPKTMLRTVRNMETFASELKDLVQSYEYSSKHLLAYIMANMQEGVEVNLYSDLLEKSGRVNEKIDSVGKQIERLADWIVSDISTDVIESVSPQA